MPRRQYWREHMPWGMRLNAITHLISSDCEDKWSVLIDTALPALGNTLGMLFTPSLDEILEEYLHPKIGRHSGRFRALGGGRAADPPSGGIRRWFGEACPDVDEAIADRLPGRSYFAGRQAGRIERWLWTGIDLLDRALWWWLLFEIGDEGTILWASNIMESRFCGQFHDVVLGWQGGGEHGDPYHAWDANSYYTFAPKRNVVIYDNGQVQSFGARPCTGELAWNISHEVTCTYVYPTSPPKLKAQIVVAVKSADGTWSHTYGPIVEEEFPGTWESSISVSFANAVAWVLQVNNLGMRSCVGFKRTVHSNGVLFATID